MLLNLQRTCALFHEEISSFAYTRNTFYFNTPARLLNFARCLSHSTIPTNDRQVGTIILEIRDFKYLLHVKDPDQRVTFTGREDGTPILEREKTLVEPMDDFRDLDNANLAFLAMSSDEVRGTRVWRKATQGKDWMEAIIALFSQTKVRKLILKGSGGNWDVWSWEGGIFDALQVVGSQDYGVLKKGGKKILGELVVDVRVDRWFGRMEDEEPPEDWTCPQTVRDDVESVKMLYGW
jgi:hypothetical protein